MQIKQEKDATVIIFDNPSGNRIKALFSFEAIFYLAAAFGSWAAALATIRNESYVAVVFSLILAVFFSIAFMRFYFKLGQKETLAINESSFTLATNANGKRSVVVYDNAGVTDLRYTGREKMLDHPLKTGNFDYLGFQTQQEVTDNLTAEGNIAFTYKHQTVRFGVGIPSWDAEKISNAFAKATNGQMMIADLPEEIPESEWMQQ